ncbi:hypothetical protein K474DRAFT_1711372 [Panus rudis PR-1116 ss-1]|nr:hypothetical protein K474DRAFT_1711372 [Panus rudis PR-1116 ss-1]
MVSLNLSECTISYKVRQDVEFPRVVKNVSLTVNHPKCANIATAYAYLFTRAACRGEFHYVLDHELDELAEFSTTLFDHNGNLRSDFIEHEHHRGTGVWGREIDKGVLVYITDVTVEEKYRRAGVGAWALRKFLGSKYVGPEDCVIVWPFPSPSARRASAKVKLTMDDVIAFYRKNGFRRIGRTVFFGYSPDAKHLSRSLAIGDDAESNEIYTNRPALEPVDDTDGPFRFEERAKKERERYKKMYPLHYAINENGTAEGSPDLVAMIRSLYTTNPEILRSRDEEGWTPLHIAAKQFEVDATRALLELPSPGPREDLTDRCNSAGVTPVEICERTLRSSSELGHMMDVRVPQSERVLATAFLLHSAAGEDVGGLSEADYVTVKKWGCTCNRCRDGWLSPRMTRRLEVEIDLAIDHIRNHLTFSPWSNHTVLSSADIEALGLNYIPMNLWPRITRGCCEGYLQLLDTIRTILQDPSQPLSSAHVLKRAGSSIEKYLTVTGPQAILYAFDAITDPNNHVDAEFNIVTMRNEETSNPVSVIVREEFKGGAIPECINDEKIDLVRFKLGINDRMMWGPYYPLIELLETRRLMEDAARRMDSDADADEEMDEDEDSEEDMDEDDDDHGEEDDEQGMSDDDDDDGWVQDD